MRVKLSDGVLLHLDLYADEIHLWLADLDWSRQALEAGYQILSEDEQHLADRFKVAHAREEYIASHSMLRNILVKYYPVPPGSLVFGKMEYGKPYLINNKDLEFNLSHTRGRALIGVAKGRPIGVDIEIHKSNIELASLAKRFFAKSEYSALIDLSPDERYFAFYRAWTRKEAFIKATGQGLSFGLDKFVVSLKPNDRSCLLSIHDNPNLAQQWELASVSLEGGTHSAAYAVFGKKLSVKKMNFNPH